MFVSGTTHPRTRCQVFGQDPSNAGVAIRRYEPALRAEKRSHRASQDVCPSSASCRRSSSVPKITAEQSFRIDPGFRYPRPMQCDGQKSSTKSAKTGDRMLPPTSNAHSGNVQWLPTMPSEVENVCDAVKCASGGASVLGVLMFALHHITLTIRN